MRPALLAGAVLLAVATGAAAVGVIPEDVGDKLANFDGEDGGFQVDWDSARIVVSAPAPDGTLELWIAETEDGGRCLYVRETEAEDGDSGCESGVDQPPPEPVEWSGEWSTAGGAVYGTVPSGARAVRVVGDSGSVQAATDNGFFLAALDAADVASLGFAGCWVVEAVRPDGSTVRSLDDCTGAAPEEQRRHRRGA